MYLKRREGRHRVLRNAAEVEALFIERGFDVVDPEQLTFAQQGSLMAKAEVVAGPEGSAMFLNFYRRPHTSLVILSHPFRRHLTNWTATLAARAIETTIVTGPVVPYAEAQSPPSAGFGYDYFVDFEIDVVRLRNTLDELESTR